MDVSICYRDDKEQMVRTRYFDSQFLERPNADNLLDSIKLSTERLRNESLLQLAMDGANVNWEVLTKLDDNLVEDGYTKSLNIGSYAQYAIHGAFQNGSVKTGWGLQQILKSIEVFLMIRQLEGKLSRLFLEQMCFPHGTPCKILLLFFPV